jgi:hypothetical protein
MASKIAVSLGLGTGQISKTADASGVLTLQTNNANGLTVSTAQNVSMNSTGGFAVPSGTTAQRPSSPVNGMLRYNTTIPQLEIYLNGWIALP